MVSLVSIDVKSPFGPAMYLICNAKYCNEKAIDEVTRLVKKNLLNSDVFKGKIKGRKAFCASVLKANRDENFYSPIQVITTPFFRTLHNSIKVQDSCHSKVKDSILPARLQEIKGRNIEIQANPEEMEEIKEWLARLIESYVAEESLEQYYFSNDRLINSERTRIGKELAECINRKEIDKERLDLLISRLKQNLEKAKEENLPPLLLHFIGEYLNLFSKDLDSSLPLASDIISKLEHGFRNRMFAENSSNS